MTPLTAAQVRQARALLGWTSLRIARTTKIGFAQVLKAQDDEAMCTLHFMDVWTIRSTLEQAGVRFTVDADGRPGTTLAGSPSP